LIDTSGSMKLTDPNNLRAESLRLLFSLLPEDCRFGLLTFDTETRTLRNPDRIASDRDALLPLLRGITSAGRDTDLERPLREAYRLLRTTGASERMILLLTDGKMDVGDPVLDRAANERLAHEILPVLAQEGIRVHTVAFSPHSDVEALKEMALVTRGFFQLVDNPERIHLAFVDVFSRTSPFHAIPLHGSRFFVDRSVSELTIVVTKQGAAQDVRLRLPDKSAHVHHRHPPGWQWFPSHAFEMITVSAPEVGTWEVEYGAEEGNSVFILTDLRLLVSPEREVVIPGEDVRVRAWLQQGEEDRVAPAPVLSETRMSGEVACPDGTRSAFPLVEGTSAQDGTPNDSPGVYQGVFKPCGPGQHDIKVTCKAMTFEREKRLQVHVVEEGRLAALPAGPTKRKPEEKTEVASITPSSPESEPAGQGPGWAWVLWRLLVVNGFLLAFSGGWIARARYRARRH